MRPLPAASLAEIARGRAPLVGARYSSRLPRGLVSPVQARLDLGLVCEDPALEEERWEQDRTSLAEAAILARAALARLLRAARAEGRARPYIVSARVDALGLEEAVEEIFAPPTERRARIVYFVHPHALNLAALDASLRRRLAAADRVLPDGIGLRIAGRVLGAPLPMNLNGTDLLPVLCREAVRRGLPLALIGGAPGVADACAARLREAHPGLAIGFQHHGYLDDRGVDRAVEALRAAGRILVLIGMGTPRQEAFCARVAPALPEATLLTVGGLFDFYAGRVPRAPLAWREAGLEWLFRLRQEPARLGRRYLVGNPAFLGLVLAQRLGLFAVPAG